MSKRFTETPLRQHDPKGPDHWKQQTTQENYKKGIEYFKRAIEKDPAYGSRVSSSLDS